MSKEIQKRCLECAHALRDPAASPDQIITGVVQHLCLEGPPTTVAFPAPQGIAMMTIYPHVNRDTISCGRFARETVIKEAE